MIRFNNSKTVVFKIFIPSFNLFLTWSYCRAWCCVTVYGNSLIKKIEIIRLANPLKESFKIERIYFLTVQRKQIQKILIRSNLIRFHLNCFTMFRPSPFLIDSSSICKCQPDSFQSLWIYQLLSSGCSGQEFPATLFDRSVVSHNLPPFLKRMDFRLQLQKVSQTCTWLIKRLIYKNFETL